MDIKTINTFGRILAVIFLIAAIICFCTSHPVKGLGFSILTIICAVPKRKRRNNSSGPFPDYLIKALNKD